MVRAMSAGGRRRTCALKRLFTPHHIALLLRACICLRAGVNVAAKITASFCLAACGNEKYTSLLHSLALPSVRATKTWRPGAALPSIGRNGTNERRYRHRAAAAAAAALPQLDSISGNWRLGSAPALAQRALAAIIASAIIAACASIMAWRARWHPAAAWRHPWRLQRQRRSSAAAISATPA